MDCLENERAFTTWESFRVPWHKQGSMACVESGVGLGGKSEGLCSVGNVG